MWKNASNNLVRLCFFNHFLFLLVLKNEKDLLTKLTPQTIFITPFNKLKNFVYTLCELFPKKNVERFSINEVWIN